MNKLHNNTVADILIVDDNPENLRLLKDLLTKQGYKVRPAFRGEDAIEAIQQHKPDLILLDIRMPGMDGFEVCRQLKASTETCEIPVIFVTLSTDPEGVEKGLKLGAVDYINKPVREGELLARVSTHLELYQMRRQLEQMVTSRTHDLQQSEEKFRRLVEGLEDKYFFYSHGVDGVFTYLSPSIKQVLGYRLEEFMTHYAEHLTDNPINKQAIKSTEQSVLGNKQPIYEMELFHKNGTTRWLEIKETPQLNDRGEVIAVEGIAHDITERKVANDALISSQQRLEEAQHLGHIGNWDLDLQTNTLFWSQEIYEIFGVDAETFTPSYEAFLGMVHPDCREEVNEAYEQSLQGDGHYEIIHRIIRKSDAEIRYVHERSRHIYDETGQVIRSVGTVQDITDTTIAEKALRRSQKMEAIGQLTGGIAHDFNNILGIILGNLHLLEKQMAADDKSQQRVENMKKACQRAVKLTKQLLGFSRNTTGPVTVTNINRLIEGMEGLIDRSLTPEVEVDHKFADDLWLTSIAPGDFEDALLNLSINARDALAGHGHLSIETRNITVDAAFCERTPGATPGDYVELAVSDNGEGISTEQQEHIFEPFYTTKEQGKGTGLGLAMVFGFVKRSGGFIKVYSELGIGTTFRIYLPRANGIDSPSEANTNQTETLPRGSETVLVVDDEDALLELAREFLEALGYRVLSASDGSQALEQLAKEPVIDLLFSDVVMPGGINGYELAEQASVNHPQIKTLLTSGYTEKSLAHNGQARFKSNMLSKPYNQAELAKRVRALLDQVAEP